LRRKNRQIKVTMDLPEKYASDEDFLMDFEAHMDAIEWKMNIDDEGGETCKMPISKIQMGSFEIEPE